MVLLAPHAKKVSVALSMALQNQFKRWWMGLLSVQNPMFLHQEKRTLYLLWKAIFILSLCSKFRRHFYLTTNSRVGCYWINVSTYPNTTVTVSDAEDAYDITARYRVNFTTFPELETRKHPSLGDIDGHIETTKRKPTEDGRRGIGNE